MSVASGSIFEVREVAEQCARLKWSRVDWSKIHHVEVYAVRADVLRDVEAFSEREPRKGRAPNLIGIRVNNPSSGEMGSDPSLEMKNSALFGMRYGLFGKPFDSHMRRMTSRQSFKNGERLVGRPIVNRDQVASLMDKVLAGFSNDVLRRRPLCQRRYC
jgi:hypothetical protein